MNDLSSMKTNEPRAITSIIQQNLSGLALTERPMHNHEKKWYVKDKEEGWEDESGEKIVKEVKSSIARKSMPVFVENNPDWQHSEKKGAEYAEIVSVTMGDLPENKGNKVLKDLENTKQIGAESKDMGNAVKMLNYANKNTLLILISQQRNQISAMYTQLQPTGGQATKFYSSVVLKLFSSESQKQAIERKIKVGDKLINEIIGRKVLWDVQFSKTSPPFQQGEYDFYFRGDPIGIDTIGDLVDLSVGLGIIEKGGAWYTVEGERYQGRDNLIAGVRENLDVQDALIAKVQDA